jgi:hypothetical protein
MSEIVVNDSEVEQTIFSTDEMTGDVTVERRFDIQPIIEDIQTLKSVSDGKGKNFWHIGKIPMGIIEKYMQEWGITFADFMKDPTHGRRILTDPNYSKFRIYEGNI